MANKVPFLHPARKAQAAQPPVPATPAIDLSSLTSVLLLQTLTNSGLLSSAISPPGPTTINASQAVQSAVPAPSTPICTPTKARGPGSPPIPSPSQLRRFLRYAERHLGVSNATMYEQDLDMHGIGPDILSQVDEKTLTDLGIRKGDIIRLQNGSQTWWNGPDAKRKRSDTVTSSGSNHSQSSSKKVAYEKWYHDGGRARFSGPPMEPGDGNPNAEYKIFYKCDSQNLWLPIPQGFAVDEEGEDNPNAFSLFSY